MAINVHNLRVYNMIVGAGSSGGEGGGGGGGSSTPSYLFIGADRDDDNGNSSGTVYAYDTSNYSAAPIKIQPSDAAVAQYFGKSISVAGTTLVIGAEGDNSYSGAFYVYDTSNLSSAPTKVVGSSTQFLGRNVVSTANYIVSSGADGVFVYDPSNLSASPTTVISSNQFNNEDILAIVGNYLAIADKFYNSSRGRVLVYDLTNLSGGVQATLTAPSPVAGRRFGMCLATAGSNLVVGTNDHNKAFVFDSSNWSSSPTELTPYDGGTYLSNFGSHVAGSSDYIVIGGNEHSGGGSMSGAIYVYDASNLSTQPTRILGPAANSRFGQELTVSGDNIAVGVPSYDNGSNANQGAAYIYDGTNLSASPTVIIASDGAGEDEFGRDIKFG